VAKLAWRVKLVAERHPGVTTETELARIGRDERAGLAELGLRLAEAKRLTAALQAQIVPAQVAAVGACPRGVQAQAVRQGALPGTVPLLVRRLAGVGATVVRLPVPGRGRGEERRRARPRQGRGGARTRLRHGLACRARAVRQVRRPLGVVLSDLAPVTLGLAERAAVGRFRPADDRLGSRAWNASVAVRPR
jgi:hypothetical protein